MGDAYDYVRDQPDFKEGPRVKASREQWKKLQAEKQGPCRVCGASAYLGYTGLHHLVPRSQGGDDVPDNLVPLCGSGTMGCHGKVEARDLYACHRLRVNLTLAEFDYMLTKKGDVWADTKYPPRNALTEESPVGKYRGQDVYTQGDFRRIDNELDGPKPGHDCPTCQRRIPYPPKDKTPTNRPWAMRIPEEARENFKEILEAASKHVGTHSQPWWQYWTIQAGLVLLLQGDKDVLKRG